MKMGIYQYRFTDFNVSEMTITTVSHSQEERDPCYWSMDSRLHGNDTKGGFVVTYKFIRYY